MGSNSKDCAPRAYYFEIALLRKIDRTVRNTTDSIDVKRFLKLELTIRNNAKN